MHLNFSDIIAAISLFWTAITFGRTVRHRPEASWMNSYIVPRMSNEDGDDVKIAIWLPDGADDMPEDARICIHWTKSPTRLRRCGYEEIPLTSELADKWWEEKDWKASHRLAERFRTWCAHRRFHHNPEDARKSPQPTI